MKKITILIAVIAGASITLGAYFLASQAGPQAASIQLNQSLTFWVDENGTGTAEWVYELPPSPLAGLMRLEIVGGTMNGVPVHGMGVENAKLKYSADVRSSYAKFGIEMENISCNITGLDEGETLKVTMNWRTPHFAYRKDNAWKILFQPIDNESYARESINATKNLQSTLSVASESSPLNYTSKESIIMPAGANIANENELLSLGIESINYGGGTTENTTTFTKQIEGRPTVVSETQALVTQQLITITEEDFLESSQFFPINYTGDSPAYGFDGSASWVATDMKFGRERDKYTVSLDGQEFNVTPYQLLYYSSKKVVNLAENSENQLLSGAQPISVLPPDNEIGNWSAVFKTLTKDNYVTTARNIRNQITSTGKAPGEINSSIGPLRPRDALFTFLRIISLHREHGELSDNIMFLPAPTDNLLNGGTEIPAKNAYFLLNTQSAITDTPQVNQIVSDIQEPSYSDKRVAEELNRWTYENITYKLVLGWFTSEEILNMGEGKCGDKVNVYLALTRTAGIPAKRVTGFIIFEQVTYPFTEIAGVTPDGRYIVGHAWTKVYVPPDGWVLADPTGNYFQTPAYENNIYSSVEETWQAVLASYETTYGELT
ncbi:hypothetical protein AKJ44_01815 [candidate division MSBL1 archaeon SCGC-AAA261F17]|uniref:Transglutaminase-like domain-containing protein n=1 Tax=candidate division MSBL1 archaeon SCGC-AAA261F17 TaxID=1698274 RepID=A0A133V670_9EURY|nr:hypothetical protein AKJ44_01815 [candidate division MSBL1 archaeon SCGC-AAA261F17]